jgi:hypothetical protein
LRRERREQGMDGLDVPLEIVHHVLSFAESLASLGRLRLVSSSWRDLIDSAPSLWARYVLLSILLPQQSTWYAHG